MYILVIISLLISVSAQIYVKLMFNKYSKVGNSRGLTGAEAARQFLAGQGVVTVGIEEVSGNLTDNFNPVTNIIRLSDKVYDEQSVAAVGVALHEAGHAMQSAEGYSLFRVRNAIVKSTNIAANISYWLVLAGIIFSSKQGNGQLGTMLLTVGILFFLVVVFFQLITLPVEFNASGRAIHYLQESGVLTEEEQAGVKKVLRAAALTYVASLTVSLLHLLRLLAIRGRRR